MHKKVMVSVIALLSLAVANAQTSTSNTTNKFYIPPIPAMHLVFQAIPKIVFAPYTGRAISSNQVKTATPTQTTNQTTTAPAATTTNVPVTTTTAPVTTSVPATLPVSTASTPTVQPAPVTSAPAVTNQPAQTSAATPASTAPAATAPATDGGKVLYSCDFENGFQDCGFTEQSAMENSSNSTRVTSTSISRTGSKGILMTTQPGDSNIHGSGSWERTDLRLSNDLSAGTQGQESWWAESVYFPNDYVMSYGTIMDFHNSSEGGNANFHLMTTQDGLRLIGFGGDQQNPQEYKVQLGMPQKNVWYDFVYHVKWSEGSDGFMEAWMNGKKVLSYQGPTLYTGQFVYLKLANYHEANGQSSSIIQDRIIRGTTASSVALTPLEGVK